jgi:hypothetical protein
MNTEDIIKSALTIVGLTQMLKSFIPLKKGWIWTVITIVVGIGVSFIPVRFLTPILAISGASLFYDTIFQTFEKVFKRTSQSGEEK